MRNSNLLQIYIKSVAYVGVVTANNQIPKSWKGEFCLRSSMKNSNFTILSLKFHKLPLKQDEILTQDKTLFGIMEAWFLCLVPFAFYEQESNRCPTVAVKCRHGDRCKCNHKTIGKKDLKIFSGFERDSVEPTSFAIPVQRSSNWAIKATWERSCVG